MGNFKMNIYICTNTGMVAILNFQSGNRKSINHFSTIGLYGGPAHYDISIRQAAIEAFVTSSFKIVLTQTFP